jgi:hypothetical protein
MRKVKSLALLMILLATLAPTSTGSVIAATDYSGGLLDNQLFNYGPNITTSSGKTGALTDNNESTSYATSQTNQWFWLNIPSTTIGAYKFKGGTGELEFYNAAGVKIYGENAPTHRDGTKKYLATPISGVTKIVFRGYVNTIYDFNAYVYVEPTPTPTPILTPIVRGNNIVNPKVAIMNYDQAKEVDLTSILPYQYSKGASIKL